MIEKYDNNFYEFLSNLALTYRLSLENLCLISGIEPTERNKQIIYENLLKYSDLNYKLLEYAYNFLFFYETINEKKSLSALARANAKKFIIKYKTADDKKSVYDELFIIDREYSKLRNLYLKNRRNLTSEEYKIIELHRLKYAFGRDYYLNDMEMPKNNLVRYESNIQNIVLKEKLEKLSEYLNDIFFSNKNPKL